jgi:XTP/dITP diphosphohydrolase
MRLLAATSNAGKAREIAAALAGLGFEVVDVNEAGVGDAPVPEETGTTFHENALLKARYYHELTGLLTVADDSGLEVAVLGGRPGLHSARYAATDAERIAKLLGELDGVPMQERTARFVCAIALVGENLAETFTGTCEGRIRHTAHGRNGFGFDPVFTPEGDTRTFAEMTRDEKEAVSHRGRALAALANFVRGW